MSCVPGSRVATPTRNQTLPAPNPTPAPTERLSSPELYAKDRLLGEINQLPESQVKNMLRQRVVEPYFKDKYPVDVDRDGHKFVVHNVVVKATQSPVGTFVGGNFTFRGREPDGGTVNGYNPVKKEMLSVPYVIPLLPSIQNKIPSKNRALDGTFLVGVTFDPKRKNFRRNITSNEYIYCE